MPASCHPIAGLRTGSAASARRFRMRGRGDRQHRRRGPAAPGPEDAWLVEVAEGASRDAGGVPVELLGDYLPLLADAATHGRRAKRRELDAVGLLGRRAAEQGISAGKVVQLYLSAARRLWQDLPMVVRSRDREAVRAAATAVLQVVDDAVATLAEGYAVARRDLVRREESLRRELIDDLLRGDSDLGTLVERAEPFGLDLARVHQVALAAPSRRLPDADAAISALEAVMFDRLGDRDVLVATKDGLLVVLAPADAAAAGRLSPALDASNELGRLMHRELSRLRRGRPWRVAVGRAHPGLYGIARSYEEAREALTMAGRLHTDTPVINAHDLLDLPGAAARPTRHRGPGPGRTQPAHAGSRRRRAAARHPGGLLRHRCGGHRVGETAARVGTHRHLPPGPGQDVDRLRPGRPRAPLHAAGGGARRQGPQLAAGATAPSCLTLDRAVKPYAGTAGQAAPRRPTGP